MSEGRKYDLGVYVLPDGSTISFSVSAHNYALAEYGALEPHFGDLRTAQDLIKDLSSDRFLKVVEVKDGYRVGACVNIPTKYRRRNITASGLEIAVIGEEEHRLVLSSISDVRRDREFEDSNLPDGVGAVNWQ